ncbi:MAG: outer membrane protein [Phycisphaerales bacterium]|nr:outer membrane protein [Phycisphaerales bacterium]MDB5356349.1 outer membrane protein [Phycisphaerales bacterium]
MIAFSVRTASILIALRAVAGLLLVLACGPIVGCSADAYRRSADREVFPLIHDREQRTLGYAPQVEVKPDEAPPVPARAYEKIPLTHQPPAEPVAIEAEQTVVPYGVLGPEFPPPAATPGFSDGFAEEKEVARAGVGDVYGPPVPEAMRRRFDLFQSLAYATQHSRPFQTQMEQLYLAALSVTLQRHLLSPIPFATTGVQYTGGQLDSKYQSALAATGTVGVKQQLPYGGQIVAQTLVQFVDALNSTTAGGESAQVALSGSIPLLRGAGMVNLEPLIQSERTLVYQVRKFEEYRRQFVVDVSRQYFQLLTSQQSVSNRRQNVANLTALLDRTQALFDAGRLNFLEVQRSEQALLQGENDLSDALANYQDSVDSFKLILGMPVEEDLDAMPSELEVNVPQLEGRDVIAVAEQYRLELQTARDQIDDARRQVAVAQNGLLPDLNVTAQTDFGNRILVSTPAKSFDDRATTYSAGVTLGLPLDRLAERNVYRQSLIQFEQAQRSFADLRDSVAAQVRAAVRGIRAAQVSLDLQRRGIRLAERRLDYSLELLKRGTASARDVVESQSSLLEAQDNFSAARATLQVSVLQFLNDTGTLRVDPEAGSIGRALNPDRSRAPYGSEERQPDPRKLTDAGR